MTKTELQDLSREVARLLPSLPGLNIPQDGCFVGRVMNRGMYSPDWLHESTEACAEIMVRVLWPANTFIASSMGGRSAYFESRDEALYVPDGPNTMQDFRTCVLLAAQEVLKEKP